MSTAVTVNLSDAIWQRAEVWAKQTGRTLPDFLVDAIEASLLPLGSTPPEFRDWTDEEVLATADGIMSTEDDRRLSELLEQQRESELNSDDRAELAGLMMVYQEGLVRKAAATQESVRRGLRPPLAP